MYVDTVYQHRGFMSRRLNIGWKLIIIYLVVAVPLMAIIALNFVERYNTQVDRTLEQHSQMANLTADNFTLFIKDIGGAMEPYGRTIIENHYPASRATSALHRLLDVYPLDHAVLADPSGIVIVSTDDSLKGQNLSRRKAFSEVIAGNETMDINPSERLKNTAGFYVVQAIRTNNSLVGIVASFVDVAKLHDALPVRVAEGGANIVDSSGYLVYQSEFPQLAQNRPYWGKFDIIGTALAGRTATTTNFVIPGTDQPRIGVEVPIEEHGWAAGSDVETRETLSPIMQDILNAVMSAAVVLLVALVISVFIARRITRPLANLVGAAETVGRGNLEQTIAIKTGDEIEDVANSLDEARLNLKQAVDSLRETNRRNDLLLQSTDEGIYGVDIDEHCTFINRAASEMTGYNFDEIIGKNVHKLIHHSYSDGSPYPKEACPIYQAYRTGQGIRDDTEIFWRKDGSSFPVEYSSYPIIENGDIKGSVVTFTDITTRKQQERLSDALNDINASITSTLDFDEIMQRVIVKATKAIGCEAALINLRENDHWIVKYGYEFPRELIGVKLTQEQAKLSSLTARAQETVVIDDAYADERLDRETIERYSLRSTISIPLTVRGDTVGTMFFVYRSAPTKFFSAQIDFANKLSASISLALENARLYATERNIADTLQEALLAMPNRIAGIEFGYLYRSPTEATRVGGDFYDLFELEHGKVGIIIGDVSGKGLEAATLTSLVKNTIRAYALEGYSPAQVIAKANELVVGASSPFLFTTVFFGMLDTETGHFTYCSAGHTHAIVKRKTCKTELLATSSPMVGAFAGLSYVDDEADIEKGDVLILYTDGVTEARCGGELFGEERLMDLVKELKSINAKALPQAIFNELSARTGGRLSDDIAILTVSLEGD